MHTYMQLLRGDNLVYSISQCLVAENPSNGFDHCVPVLCLPIFLAPPFSQILKSSLQAIHGPKFVTARMLAGVSGGSLKCAVSVGHCACT